jgi:hypothetical protein
LNSSHSQVSWGGIFWYSLMWPSTGHGQFSLVQECYVGMPSANIGIDLKEILIIVGSFP